MNYEANELSVAQGQVKVRRARLAAELPARETDPALTAWSRLVVLEQSSVLIAKHLLRRLREQPADRTDSAAS
jgi:hypothetical protein